MKKLDKSKVEWIISQKRKGVATSSIAETMNVSARRVKKLWARYKHVNAGKIIYPDPMFEYATTENALAVLDEAIKNHGKPASIMTDRGSQFYVNASEAKKKGASIFEKRLVELGIKQILAGVRHPQTNGKLERLHGEIQRKLPEFEAIMTRKSDPVDLFMEWYNHRRPHMSLSVDGQEEILAQVLARKMLAKGEIVVD